MAGSTELETRITQLESQQGLWQALLLNSVEMIIVLNTDLTIADYNRLAIPARREDILGKPIKAFFSPAEWELAGAAYQQAQTTRQTTYYETQGVYQGVTHYWQTKVMPVVEGEVVTALILIASDVTERRQSEIALRASESRYRQILDAMPDFILVKSAKSRIEWANKAFREYYGMSEEALAGLTDVPFSEPDYTQQYVKDDEEVFTTGKVLHIPDEPVTRHDGEVRHFSTVKSPIFDDQQQVVYTVGVSRDITEQRTQQAAHDAWQQQIIEGQKQALIEVSTPVIPVLDDILIMPLIGSIDTARAQDIMRALLKAISSYRAKIVIVDITGVPIVDSGVASHLHKTIQAARLKGAQTIITGVSDAVAETIVDLGIDWQSIKTLRDLQAGLRHALDQLGRTLH